jgi:hypothetical protein
MALQPKDRLGPYEIVALLGVGGMGEVYRGRDTRLGRDVALKVISPKRLGDDDLRRRFELEARAASVLNHPSIVTIYDVGDTDGVAWIAMEWVEGRTLRLALLEADGPLPLSDALTIARQVAEGLAAARGGWSTDLKPERHARSGRTEQDPRFRPGPSVCCRVARGLGVWSRNPGRLSERPGRFEGGSRDGGLHRPNRRRAVRGLPLRLSSRPD